VVLIPLSQKFKTPFFQKLFIAFAIIFLLRNNRV
jgi:hypothetical protein